MVVEILGVGLIVQDSTVSGVAFLRESDGAAICLCGGPAKNPRPRFRNRMHNAGSQMKLKIFWAHVGTLRTFRLDSKNRGFDSTCVLMRVQKI